MDVYLQATKRRQMYRKVVVSSVVVMRRIMA